MYDAYAKAASAEDYENKWMYFGGADGAYSIFPGGYKKSKSFKRKCEAGCLPCRSMGHSQAIPPAAERDTLRPPYFVCCPSLTRV